ncbi:MAG TPA: hypothetical protein VM555_04155, partial [Tahibacter sp.]|nr:hypothetical protein [Tahibacter sp.]
VGTPWGGAAILAARRRGATAAWDRDGNENVQLADLADIRGPVGGAAAVAGIREAVHALVFDAYPTATRARHHDDTAFRWPGGRRRA